MGVEQRVGQLADAAGSEATKERHDVVQHVESIEQRNDVSDGSWVAPGGRERLAEPLRVSRLEIEDPLQ